MNRRSSALSGDRGQGHVRAQSALTGWGSAVCTPIAWAVVVGILAMGTSRSATAAPTDRVPLRQAAWVHEANIGGTALVDIVGFPGGGLIVLDSRTKSRLFEHAGSASAGGFFDRFAKKFRRFRAPTGRMATAVELRLCVPKASAPKHRESERCRAFYLWQSPTGISMLADDFTPVKPIAYGPTTP